MRARRTACRWALAWLLAVGLGAVAEAAPAQPVLRLTQAQVAPGDGDLPPESGWRPVVLADHFAVERPPADRIGWYRFTFDLPAAPQRPLVLLAQRVVTTAEFRVNGSLLNDGVRFGHAGGPAGTSMLSWPHWFVLPAGVLHAGRNELTVRLAGNGAVSPHLSGLSIGPAEALRSEFLLRDIMQRQVPQVLAVLLAVALVFALGAWQRDRQSLQARLVVTAALWLGMLLIYLFPDLPVPQATFNALMVVLFVAFHWALQDVLWRLSRSGWDWFPRVLAWGSALPLAAALAVLAFGPREDWLAALMLPSMLLRLLTTVMLLRWVWQERSWSALLLTAAELLWFFGPVQTMLVGLGLLSGHPFMLTPGNALPLVVVLLLQAAQRLLREREAAARQREAAVLAERRRMMLDMHDGIGAHLVAAVRLTRRDDVPRAQVEQLVQEALDDLRLIIDSLDPGVQALQPLLGQLRQRAEPRLHALGLRLDWQVDETAPYPLSPSEALDVLRFVQEAMANAVRHAGARTIGLALVAVPPGCELRVFDDGAGMAAVRTDAASPGGRGLDSLRRRALRLGAQWSLRPRTEGGTEVALRLPAPRARAWDGPWA